MPGVPREVMSGERMQQEMGAEQRPPSAVSGLKPHSYQGTAVARVMGNA